jgi:hypothetical protein
MEMVIENGDLPSRKELGEQLQNEYPGAVVQNVYPSTPKGTVTITSAKHYNHGTLSWIDEDWQSANRKDRTDGMSKDTVKKYRQENPGSKLQTAVTEKNPEGKRKKRRSSFCSRMKGMKSKRTSSKTARDPDSRINKALRRWNCR